jgi:RimJ/RimL family protein N-acetyltransferase
MARENRVRASAIVTEPSHDLHTRPVAGRWQPWVACASDIEALVALKATVATDTYSSLATTPQWSEWQQRFCSPTYFAERLGPDAIFLAVGPRQQPIAMGALKYRDGKAYIGDLYCATRGQGWGRLLFDSMLELARQRGLRVAVCDVFESNVPALRFFAKLGFIPVSSWEEQSLKVPVIRHERLI